MAILRREARPVQPIQHGNHRFFPPERTSQPPWYRCPASTMHAVGIGVKFRRPRLGLAVVQLVGARALIRLAVISGIR